MLELYITILVTLSGLGFILGFVFLFMIRFGEEETWLHAFRAATFIFAVPTLVGILWPVAAISLPLVVPAALGYGVFNVARVIKHRGFNFE